MAWYTEVADMIAKFTVNSQGLAGVKGALSATEGSVLGSLVKQTERGSLNSIMSAMKGVGAEFSDDFAKEIAGSAGTTSRASIFEKLAANAGENYKPNEAMEKLIKDYTTDSDMAKRFSTYLSSGGTQADVAKYLGKKETLLVLVVSLKDILVTKLMVLSAKKLLLEAMRQGLLVFALFLVAI